MRYLAQVNNVPDHWYPSKAKGYAKRCLQLFTSRSVSDSAYGRFVFQATHKGVPG